MNHLSVSVWQFQHLLQLAPTQFCIFRPELFGISVNRILPVDAHKPACDRRSQAILGLSKFRYAFVSVLFVELLIVNLSQSVSDPDKTLFHSQEFLFQFLFHLYPVIQGHLHIFHVYLLTLWPPSGLFPSAFLFSVSSASCSAMTAYSFHLVFCPCPRTTAISLDFLHLSQP